MSKNVMGLFGDPPPVKKASHMKTMCNVRPQSAISVANPHTGRKLLCGNPSQKSDNNVTLNVSGSSGVSMASVSSHSTHSIHYNNNNHHHNHSHKDNQKQHQKSKSFASLQQHESEMRKPLSPIQNLQTSSATHITWHPGKLNQKPAQHQKTFCLSASAGHASTTT